MVLNTSFNRKGQPIVETPIDALRTFLQCRGKVGTLFMDRWEIKLRPFPLSPSNSEGPSEEEGGMAVFAQPFYLSEQTCSATSPDTPLRTRVQVGGGEDEEGEGEWVDLPSSLHLDLLQLLQPDPNAAYEASGDLLISDLYEILRELKGEALSWGEMRGALQWLFEEMLVHFEGGVVMGSSSEQSSLESLFGEDVTITDLR